MIQPVKEKIILGIDPGTTIMGYGVLRVAGTKPEMIAMGIIDLRKFGDHYLKLRHIHERVLGIIESYLPDELAIEAPFFGKNVQSMLKLGRAQGVAMAAALSRDIPITEYAPLKIKMAITGNGQASKEQVADMLQRMLFSEGGNARIHGCHRRACRCLLPFSANGASCCRERISRLERLHSQESRQSKTLTYTLYVILNILYLKILP